MGVLKPPKTANTITQFRTTRSALLLARLATNPSKFHPREELAYWLWPEEEERQRQLLRLRGELSEIRTTLGEDVIDKQGNTSVRLIEGIQSDVHQFQNKLLASVRAEQAIFRIPLLREAQALYQGDFLAGFYDDWALLERERLQEAYCDVATRLILDLERTNQRSEAQTLRRNIAHQFPEHPLPPMPLVAVESPLSPIAVIPETGEGFFGRETEIMTIQQWGQDPKGSPLLTLLGPGGMGKTRLSQESLPAAIFVSLAEVMEATTGFFEAIHRALGLPQGDAPVRDQVIHTLKSREKPILILDNFEQIVEGGASLVKSLLADCPNLRLLVTSRRRLGLATEKELWLPALPPTNGVSLFLDRARRARPDFGQSHNAYSVVEEIVALLEGLPPCHRAMRRPKRGSRPCPNSRATEKPDRFFGQSPLRHRGASPKRSHRPRLVTPPALPGAQTRLRPPFHFSGGLDTRSRRNCLQRLWPECPRHPRRLARS